ncbi:MAG: hypothetical protein ACOY94_02020 [Bacillota bacterium]
MSATSAVKIGRSGRLGVMVRTATELYIYWRPSVGGTPGPLSLRVTDLSGRPVGESLDGRGYREVPLGDSVYVPDLLPGHLYVAEVGRTQPEGFTPLLSVGPVQTPWVAAPDGSPFPAPYHRS